MDGLPGDPDDTSRVPGDDRAEPPRPGDPFDDDEFPFDDDTPLFDEDDEDEAAPVPETPRFDPGLPPGGARSVADDSDLDWARPADHVESAVAADDDDTPGTDTPSAPPVVIVVVTNDPGPWFEEAMAALGEQDYPALSILVIDAGSVDDPTPRVASVLPSAFVRRLPGNVGFATAANEVLQVVEGASHFVFAHDDVAPSPDAVRLMVEEAYRSNAGVVTPKLVDWDDAQRLLQVGLGADKSGAPADLVEAGELDQEQHDAVRDVFCAPGAFTLVRADLFSTLGGFDPAMVAYGEDLDLSWRAQVAGARVIVAPAARVRHREAMSLGLRAVPGTVTRARSVRDRARPLMLRHRVRTVLTCYSLWHLIRVLPQVAILAAAEIVYGIATGRRAAASAVFGAWRWNLGNLSEIRRRRQQLRAVRVLPDSEVRRLQIPGSARMIAFVRGQLTGDEQHPSRLAEGLASTRAELAGGRNRAAMVAWAAIAFVLLFGSRELLTGRLPAVGEFAPFPENPGNLLSSFLSGWRTTGLGADAPAPTAFALLGLLGTLLLGAMGLLQKLLVLGPLVAGVVGVHRLAAPLGPRARVVAAVVYAALPLPYDALAGGRWSGLIAYGMAPWAAKRLFEASGLEPFAAAPTAPDGDRTGRWPRQQSTGRPLLRASVALGLLTALAAALAPTVVVVPLLIAAGLVVGSVVAGGTAAAARALAVAAGALVVAVALLFPWTLDFVLPGSTWASIAGVDVAPARALGLGRLLRFETGPVGAAPLGWAFVVAAALPLVVGGGWRLAWAARLWFVAAMAWGVALVGGRFAVGLPAVELLLAPAALAVALAVALGLAAFEIDLPAYRFGWRQAASVTAAIAVVFGAVPWVWTATGGRWNVPRQDLASLVAWMPEQRAEGDFRVLWLGDPDTMPLGGWRLDEGVAYATSRGGAPTVLDLWPSASPGAADLVGDAVRAARRGGTTSLGHLLAPMAVRYVVLPQRAAPGRDRSGARPLPEDLRDALAAQVDLRQMETDRSIEIYENAAWGPIRSRVDAPLLESLRRPGLAASVLTDLTGAQAVLERGNGRTRFTGAVTPGYVYVAEAASSRWELTVGGQRAAHDRAAWANAFAVDRAGAGTLRYRTSPARYLALLIEFGLWVGAARWVWQTRRRRRHA